MADTGKSFIEVQFPVSKVSKESYKERKANLGQTLTGLGKWWGRKPLILVRAAILGLLLPATDNAEKDREIFLKILTMDDAGLLKRKNKSIPVSIIYENLSASERKRYFKENTSKAEYKTTVSKEEKQELQETVFLRLSYDEKLKYCLRPEELENLDREQWGQINAHLGTEAFSIQELVQELGWKRFGQSPTVGDCFCGGGSIPFEATRIGCDAHASDLNPIAGLLTWAALNIYGSTIEEVDKLKKFQEKIYNLADQQIKEWGIEHNLEDHRANDFLYCNEAVCPECGWKVPLAPSWVIGQGTKTIAILKENRGSFDIVIKSSASDFDIKKAESMATIKDSKLVCPHCHHTAPISALRKDRKRPDGNMEYGLRKWEKEEYLPRENDVFQERLYCIRYERQDGKRFYTMPSQEDLVREEKVNKLLHERFSDWQRNGFLPSNKIEEGYNTSQLIRERGWQYWHQLFNPRQLLLHGLLMELINREADNNIEKVCGLLQVNKCCDWNSKLCIWHSGSGIEKSQNTFFNQALNTLFNYGTRGLKSLETCCFFKINRYNLNDNEISLKDARTINGDNILIWITDPPYADAVNYHELSEFFLAWDKKNLIGIFKDWYIDSKRTLAVKGNGESFNNSMIEIFNNLANCMPDNGMQIVMFTHQNVRVWADLTLILWCSGLRVTAAWNIATETESGGLKDGNYVKGTVLLVLRKQVSDSTAYLDELYPEIETEVKNQIDSMQEIDDKDDPNFSDADYLLAAYAASLKVLTSYKKIEDIDVKYELSKTRRSGDVSPVERIINEAVKIAYDCLIPGGFDSYTWKSLIPEERLYIKGLDLEKEGVYQLSAYQELARGFGVKEYKDLLAATKANQARLKTALEFGTRGLSDSTKFGGSLLRNILAALHLSINGEDTVKGKNWLRNEMPNYWQQRNAIIEILDYLATLDHIENMSHWSQEAKYAKLLRELIKNDGV